MWSLDATPEDVQKIWEHNAPYQAPIDKVPSKEAKSLGLNDRATFDACLGKDECYIHFLEFYRQQIAKNGVPAVVREYLLQGDDRANDIHCRMYPDLVHPMIHFGCAIEWNQPALVAEALAAASVHENWCNTFILETERYTRDNPPQPAQSLLSVILDMQADPTIANGVKHDDPFNKLGDGLLKRVGGAYFSPYLSRLQVQPTEADIRQKLAEMMYTGAYMLAAAQREGKRVAFDFVLLHNVTLGGYYPAIIGQPWLTLEEKARLLETKMRVDAIMFAGCGSPKLVPESILEYVPVRPRDGWPELIRRAIEYQDEGHAVKLIRALLAMEQHFGEDDDVAPSLPTKRKDLMTIAHMAMDSVETAMAPGGSTMPKERGAMVVKNVGHGGEMVRDNLIRWVFYGGLDHAWDFVPPPMAIVS